MMLWLSPQQAGQLVEAARNGAPREVCGVLAGSAGRVCEVTTIANIAAQPERGFRMDERALAQALTGLAARGLEPLAFYHSHPHSDPRPSALDIAEANYPDVAMLIIGLRPSPALMAWSVRWGELTPIELVVSAARPGPAIPRWTMAARIAVMIAVVAAVALLLVIAFSLLPPPPQIPPTPMPR